ncbi:transglycosylase SLT domain-containing protein [Salmonella enterica subsp. enterica serovar Muenchen]|uniref:lytic transglycosylase domain-containing protein n=1 Tax=Enterobacteriaceae TaxID=543 RepID=UPI0009E7F720|nr:MULTISPECIES: lytic transglycosylase domain-containing protein [Enterobacteriaceae]EBQ5245207.1 lytic transglycosylase domain-containing protein [Salmonella enterica subsp. salamae]EDB1684703.1 lytic transglycosylase domain-containing protein [Salmonella enterica subsp. enterica serovar Muenchen]EDD2790001.1 transglycosylase SLT domain-containing protein [Salmonella enterica subsp. enterica serovar Muenchen]CAH6619206.1 Type IV secretion system protein virB1 [Escherichia coli]
MLSTAALLSFAMQCAVSVHPDTVSAIAQTESGLRPLAIGVVGQSKGIYPANINDALAHVARLKAEGKNYSIGLMQINKSNFSKFNVTEEQLFNPCENLKVFEKIFTDCFLGGGTLIRALSCYYSGNYERGNKRESEFDNTSYTERIGYRSEVKYLVPSIKEDISKVNSVDNINRNQKIVIIYPSRLIRGDLQENLIQESQ